MTDLRAAILQAFDIVSSHAGRRDFPKVCEQRADFLMALITTPYTQSEIEARVEKLEETVRLLDLIHYGED